MPLLGEAGGVEGKGAWNNLKNLDGNLCAEGGRSDCSAKLLEDTKDRHHNEPAKNSSGKPKEEWTFAIDLTLNLRENNKYGHIGAEEKSAWLKSFAEQTNGKPVAMLVQVRTGGTSNTADSPDPAGIERYLIRN